MHHVFFIHSSINGHLDCIYLLAIVNSAALNTGTCVSLNYSFLSVYTQWWMGGSYNSSIFSFLRNLHTIFYKQLMQLNIKKNKQPNQKMEDLNRHFSKWPINTWKDTQHHSLLEKCKSKLQWSITPVRKGIIKKSTNNKCWRGCGENRTLLHCWWNVNWYIISLKK